MPTRVRSNPLQLSTEYTYMLKRIKYLLGAACAALVLGSCSQVGSVAGVSGGGKLVVLDIGHFVGGEGAMTPGPVNGKRLAENAFWYQYSYYAKKEIEKAGYRCVVCNRGNAPATEPLASYARRAGVVHLKHPDHNAARYPSRYHADRVGSGVVSADYGIYCKADAMVFLHHNSSSNGWTGGASPSIIICNRYNGRPLANSIASTLNREILNHGMPNGGRECGVIARYVDADRSAAWMNACDDSGIPAAVIEAAFLNNRGHAEFLADDANARRYAESIGRGIVAYLRSGQRVNHVRANENQADEGSFGYAAESRRLSVPGAKLLVR